MLPHYRQPYVAFQDFPVLDEFGCHQDLADGSAVLQSLPTPLPWQLADNGEVTEAISPDGGTVSAQDFKQDAQRFALSFARDVRALHGHNHDHNCSFACVKYVKQAVKKVADAGLNTLTNIVCRVFSSTSPYRSRYGRPGLNVCDEYAAAARHALRSLSSPAPACTMNLAAHKWSDTRLFADARLTLARPGPDATWTSNSCPELQ